MGWLGVLLAADIGAQLATVFAIEGPQGFYYYFQLSS
jgi:hypothetical protein